MQYLLEGKVYSLVKSLVSIFEHSTVTRSTVLDGGRLITLIDSNLQITNV
jgi:hypothetical protein